MNYMAAVEDMLRYRGFETVERYHSGPYSFVYGGNQRNKEHPRPLGGALCVVDQNTTFASQDIGKTMRVLYVEALRRQLDPSSSILFLYLFQPTRIRSNTIERSYGTILQEFLHEKPTYYLEEIHLSLLNVDRSLPRSTRRWTLMREDQFVMAYGRNGEGIVIDRPPLVMNECPWMRYIGGRPDDYAMFERLENMEVGPMWMVNMRKVGSRVESKIAETSSEEPGESEPVMKLRNPGKARG